MFKNDPPPYLSHKSKSTPSSLRFRSEIRVPSVSEELVFGGEMAEDSASVLIGASELNSGADSLSPDDLDWVDSCLVNDPDLSNADWSDVKDALVEILGLQPESHESSAPDADDGCPGVPLQSPSIENGDMLGTGGPEHIDDVLGHMEMEIEYERVLPAVEETAMTPLQPFGEEGSEATVIDVFQPHYREDNQRVTGPVDPSLDFNFPADEPEPSAEDIFKVWDLGIPAEAEEVDELAEQLNKALSGSSSVQPEPLPYGDSRELIDLKEEPLDDLIAGITGLNLD